MFPLAFLLAVRLAPEAGAPEYKQPQLAVVRQTVALTYGAGSTVYFAQAPIDSLKFAAPVKVADAKFLALGRHRGPRIATSSRSIVIAAITGEAGGGKDGNVVAWRSTDGGATWSKGARVNDVAASAREGLHALAAGGNGTYFAVWLDLRTRGMKLYGSVSTDDGATWSPNRLVYESPDGHICECCHPSAFVSADGKIHVMWRNWLGGSRDMYAVVSSDSGRTFQKAAKLGAGTWPLNACPMDGGGIVVAANGKVTTVWRRETTVYITGTGERETALGPGKDAALALGADGPYAVWWTQAGLRAKVPGRATPVVLSEDGAFPSVAGSGPVIAAWESKGGITVEKLPVGRAPTD